LFTLGLAFGLTVWSLLMLIVGMALERSAGEGDAVDAGEGADRLHEIVYDELEERTGGDD